MKRILFSLMFLLLVGADLYADCTFEGSSYPEGTIRGPYICIDGEWIRR
jgi:hypothetical protein